MELLDAFLLAVIAAVTDVIGILQTLLEAVSLFGY